MKRKRLNYELAEIFASMLESNEECMGEHAAFVVTCEQLEIDEMDGYKLLHLLSEKKPNEGR